MCGGSTATGRRWSAPKLQLTNRPLFPIEQFALGGIDTVRGYREYLTVTDDAALISAELHIPVGKLRLPYLAKTDDAGTMQFVPFYDYGRGWNVDRPTPYPPNISGVGAGLRWLIGRGSPPNSITPRRCATFASATRSKTAASISG